MQNFRGCINWDEVRLQASDRPKQLTPPRWKLHAWSRKHSPHGSDRRLCPSSILRALILPAHCCSIPKRWSKMAATIFQAAGWRKEQRKGTTVCTSCLIGNGPGNWLATLVTCSYLAARETGKRGPYSQQQCAQQRNHIAMKEWRKHLGEQLIVSL